MKKSIIIALFIFCIVTLVSCTDHTHNYAAATCYSPETCTICGATRGDAVSHNYEEVSKVLATCTVDGVIKYKCSYCSDSYDEVLPSTGHTLNSINVCTTCGYAKGEEQIPEGELTYQQIVDILNKDYIPDVAYEDIYLPDMISGSTGRIYWATSDDGVITTDGKIIRGSKDTKVTLTASIVFLGVTLKFMKEVTVKAYALKPIDNKKLVIAYFYPSSGVNVSTTDLEKIDYINYSFGGISNGKVVINNDTNLKKTLSYHSQGVRVGLALGGWGAGGFSEAMMTPSSRTILVNSVMETIIKYNLDGIDIDWEYPTSSVAGITSNPADRNNLTLFCKELKEAMLNYRKDLLLTIAIAPSNAFYDLKALTEYIDYFNVMTYDFAMDYNAIHLTNLSGNYASSAEKSINFVKNYVPVEKIVIGGAFYGRMGTFASSTNTTIGAPLSTSLAKGAISYTKIKENITKHHWKEQYDESSGAAYIIEGTTFITYDSTKSIAAKAKYVLDNNLGGIMFWDLSQDTTGDLLDAIDVTLNK